MLDIGAYQIEALRGKKPTSATLAQRGASWYLNIVIEEIESPPVEGPSIGIDLGLRNIAYTSTGLAISGNSCRYCPPKFESKIGSKEPKNRLKLFIRIGSRAGTLSNSSCA